MNKSAYNDGYLVAKRRGGNLQSIKGAISDCNDMGWNYLMSYFEGQAAAITEMEEAEL